jgi:hypothetical protein
MAVVPFSAIETTGLGGTLVTATMANNSKGGTE